MTSTHPNRFSIAGYDGTAVLLMACSVYAVAAAVALVGFDLPTAARIPLALPLVLFVPGYGVVSALFPPVDFPERLAGVGREDRHPAFGFATAERGVLSVIASIVVVPAVALAANPVTGIELTPVLAGVAGVTVVSSAVAVLRIRGARNGLARPDGRSGLRAIGVAKPARDSLTFVTAVLDWGAAQAGDPRYELAWAVREFSWRSPLDSPAHDRVRDALFEAYEAERGTAFDRESDAFEERQRFYRAVTWITECRWFEYWWADADEAVREGRAARLRENVRELR